MVHKDKADIVYALADYKQLVVAYKTKYAQMVRQVAFWKTCVLWLSGILIVVGGAAVSEYFKSLDAISSRQRNSVLSEERERSLVRAVESAKFELSKTREELDKKEMIIKQLEENVSTTSKKLLEKLLPDQESVRAK